jgi:hypothetical protein
VSSAFIAAPCAFAITNKVDKTFVRGHIFSLIIAQIADRPPEAHSQTHRRSSGFGTRGPKQFIRGGLDFKILEVSPNLAVSLSSKVLKQ